MKNKIITCNWVHNITLYPACYGLLEREEEKLKSITFYFLLTNKCEHNFKTICIKIFGYVS